MQEEEKSREKMFRTNSFTVILFFCFLHVFFVRLFLFFQWYTLPAIVNSIEFHWKVHRAYYSHRTIAAAINNFLFAHAHTLVACVVLSNFIYVQQWRTHRLSWRYSRSLDASCYTVVVLVRDIEWASAWRDRALKKIVFLRFKNSTIWLQKLSERYMHT